jgi:hypothetical protein
MHSQLINMDLQEGIIVKGIYYIHLHSFPTKTFTWGHISVFDKYLHYHYESVKSSNM